VARSRRFDSGLVFNGIARCGPLRLSVFAYMASTRAGAGALPFLAHMPVGYREHSLSESARRVLDGVWTSVSARNDVTLIEPDGCVDVIVHTSIVSETRRRRPSAVVVGAMTRARPVPVREGDVHIGIRFRPGRAYAALGVPLDQFTDVVRPLHPLALAQARYVADALARADDMESLVCTLSAMFVAIEREPDPVQRAIDALESSHGRLPLSECSELAMLSDRQFRRACATRTGLSPKRLARILRFRHVVSTLRTGIAPSMSRLAASCGYSDQAHMIREVRTYSGRSPSQIADGRPA
jgi:AraC-like DNA-binding protein